MSPGGGGGLVAGRACSCGVVPGGHRLPLQSGYQIVNGQMGHGGSRPQRRAGDVRDHEAVGQSKQRVVGRQWLRIRHVEGSTCDRLARQGLDQGVGVDHRPPGDIHQIGVRTHGR